MYALAPSSGAWAPCGAGALGLCPPAQALLPHLQTRLVSVLSWGRNTEHQCGIEGHQPVITQPTAVLELLQAPVTSLAAGRNNSAAAVQGSDAYVWGDGLCGKLGLGSGVHASAPSRVEAFVGRCAIQGVALGHHHSLFLDTVGRLWAAGENKEGQCGLGTPLVELARQHRQAYENALRRLRIDTQQAQHADYLQASAAAAAAAASASSSGHIARGWGTLYEESSRQQQRGGADWGVSSSSSSRRQRSWLSAPGDSSSSSSAGIGGSSDGWVASYLGGGGMEARAHMRALQMQPGQAHLPVLVGGTGAHTLLQQQQQQQQALEQQWRDTLGSNEDGSSSSSSSGGLCDEFVVSMAASKYFSAAVTSRGEVWTFGACYNGALGGEQGSTWQTHASRVSGSISQAIAERGGATAVAAGSAFTAVLTASGQVLLWGNLATHGNTFPGRGTPPGGAGVSGVGGCAGSDGAAGLASQAAAAGKGCAQEAGPAAAAAEHAGQTWQEVALPRGVHVQMIAAGQQHLLMCDGERVWAVGRWLDDAGVEAGGAPVAAPQQILAVPGASIVKVSAGLHSSAAVDGDGKLWMWGRVLNPAAAGAAVHAGLVLPVGGAGRGSSAAAATAAEASVMNAAEAARRLVGVDWGWAGFGGAAPCVVDGLLGVRDVALGGWHVLAMTD